MKKIISFTLVLLLIIVPQVPFAQQFNLAQLPQPGTSVLPTAQTQPLLVKGLVVYPNEPLKFRFIVDPGSLHGNDASIKEQSTQIMKYFLSAVAIPESDLWVNLSPYEHDRMITSTLGETELGRDMLAQDYVLKQFTATLMDPHQAAGQEFWGRIFTEAREKFGTTNIPVNSFNKVWIVPAEAQVFERGNSVYVTKAKLKVMLESDYLAQKRGEQSQVQADTTTSIFTKQLMREIIVPAIEREVNTGANFVTVRQIYYAGILARWYRDLIKNSLMDDLYPDSKSINGIDLTDKNLKEKIYQRYIRAYKKGVANFIREDVDSITGNVVPRKYFIGGIPTGVACLNPAQLTVTSDPAAVTDKNDVAVDFATLARKVTFSTRDLNDRYLGPFRQIFAGAKQIDPIVPAVEGQKVFGRLVPASSETANVDDLQAIKLMFDPRPGARAILVKDYDEMTYLMTLGIIVVELLTLSEKSKVEKYRFGLATGSTTESTRMLLGMLDEIKRLYGEDFLLRILHALGADDIETLDFDKVMEKVNGILTLDDYGWTNRFLFGRNRRMAELAAYRNEQLYMMLMNRFRVNWTNEQERRAQVESHFGSKFISPVLYAASAVKAHYTFRRLLRDFDREPTKLLWTMNGLGVDGHEGFTEPKRVVPDTSGEIKTNIKENLEEGNSKVKRIIDSLKILDQDNRLFRPDGLVELYDLTRVQNSFHFIDSDRQFHPFFLRFMGDHRTYNLLDLFEVMSRMSREEILNSYPAAGDEKFRFKGNNEEEQWQNFLDEFRYVLLNFRRTPRFGITQQTADLINRQWFGFNFFGANAPRKQEAFYRTWSKVTSTATCSFAHTLPNAIFVVTKDALSPKVDPNTLFHLVPSQDSPIARVTEKGILDAWLKTAEGQRYENIKNHKNWSPYPARREPPADAAQVGGIDFEDINIDRTGNSNIKFNEAALRGMEEENFDGLTPVFLSMSEIDSPLAAMGVK